MQPTLVSGNVSNLYTCSLAWGGWGSNPRPADYENYGPALRARYLHGYHGAVPPMALIAPFGRVARSTTYSGRQPIPTTKRHY